MPAFEPAPTFCRKRGSRLNESASARMPGAWRALKGFRASALAMLVLALALLGAPGCEPAEKVDADVARRHAELRAHRLAENVRRVADERIFLHPNSERQRAARKAQLMLDELIERAPKTRQERPARDPQGASPGEQEE